MDACIRAFAIAVLGCAAWGADAGWKRIDTPGSGSYVIRYLPASVDQAHAAPLAVFFHGSGGTPEAYEPYVAAAAEAAGLVLVLPRSLDPAGWDDTDIGTVNEGLAAVQGELTIDPARISLSGHSAGAAMAYLVAYTTVSRANAVFTLAAPYYRVDAIADSAYTAPIRMYYGDADPNYTGGSYAALIAQWDRLGVAHEQDVHAGLGHNSLPADALRAGFVFLAGRTYPLSGGTGGGTSTGTTGGGSSGAGGGTGGASASSSGSGHSRCGLSAGLAGVLIAALGALQAQRRRSPKAPDAPAR